MAGLTRKSVKRPSDLLSATMLGLWIGIVVLTILSMPLLGIGAIVVPIISIPLWLGLGLAIAWARGQWNPRRAPMRARRLPTPSGQVQYEADDMSTVVERLSQVNDRKSFVAFLEALFADRMDAIAKEREQPRELFDPPHNEWENDTIEEFLAAGLRSIRAAPKLPVPITAWRECAVLLYLGKVSAPEERCRQQATARRMREPRNEVIMRMDEGTARLLYDVITLVGEHHAAGAPIPRLPRDDDHRLTALYDELGGQLGISRVAERMRRIRDQSGSSRAAGQQDDPPAEPNAPGV
jgi:hypothetical protein